MCLIIHDLVLYSLNLSINLALLPYTKSKAPIVPRPGSTKHSQYQADVLHALPHLLLHVANVADDQIHEYPAPSV